MDGALISIRVVLRSYKTFVSSRFDPYREKVAEEMLLCEVMVQLEPALHDEASAYEVPCSRTVRSFYLCRGSCRRTALIFKHYV
jgi:hypothetical protein